MSRIGFLPIDVRGLDCSFDASSNSILFSTAAFKKSYQLPKSIECSFDGSSIRLSLSSSAFSSCVVGLHRSLLNSLVLGIRKPNSKKLFLTGVGYKAELKGSYLALNLGYSHAIKYKLVEGVKFSCPKPTEILLSSSDSCLLGAVASDLCSLRKYDPYKGKGILIEGKFALRKESSKK